VTAPRTVLFVHAHPDDESSKGGATMARYAAEGHRVVLVTCTDGAAGDILNPAADDPAERERMPAVREEELAEALDTLGVTVAYQLGYPDSGFVDEFRPWQGSRLAREAFFNIPVDEVAARVTGIIRAEQPDVVVTYPPDGGYPHPDHVRTHHVAARAFAAAPDPGQFPAAGPVWTPAKLYYTRVFSRSKLAALHAATLGAGLESPYTEFLDRAPHLLYQRDPSTTHVDVGAHLGQRDEALKAHRTQVDPGGRWFAVPRSIAAEVWPWDDFELGFTRVGTRLPEDSLFAGLG